MASFAHFLTSDVVAFGFRVRYALYMTSACVSARSKNARRQLLMRWRAWKESANDEVRAPQESTYNLYYPIRRLQREIVGTFGGQRVNKLLQNFDYAEGTWCRGF